MARAKSAWWMMDRRIDWQALPSVIALLGVDDEERFLVELLTLKDFVERSQNAEHR